MRTGAGGFNKLKIDPDGTIEFQFGGRGGGGGRTRKEGFTNLKTERRESINRKDGAESSPTSMGIGRGGKPYQAEETPGTQ